MAKSGKMLNYVGTDVTTGHLLSPLACFPSHTRSELTALSSETLSKVSDTGNVCVYTQGFDSTFNVLAHNSQ